MKRNAFTADFTGKIEHYEPDMECEHDSVSGYIVAQRRITRHRGASLCLSQTVTLDALLSLQQVLQSELTVRAEMESEPEFYTL